MLGIDDQSEQCDRDQPPVGWPCGIAERSGINAKPSMKGKTKTIPARGAVSLPLVGPETVAHKSIFKERRPAYPIPVPQAHSWMRKCWGRHNISKNLPRSLILINLNIGGVFASGAVETAFLLQLRALG